MEAEQCADEISSDVSGLQTIATRLQRGERSPSKAKTELGRVLRALTALGNRPVRLVGEARLFVAIDPADLGAILISLIERALMVSPRVELRYREHEAGALVEVSDETALTQSALESLFDPYANTLPGGDGRSLALARELAIESGGSLSAEVDGEATRVSLVLPRTD